MFGGTNIVKHNAKEKLLYSDYEIRFDGEGEWNFVNIFARNVITSGVDNSSSTHTNKRKYNSLVLGKGSTYDNNGSFCAPEKKSGVNLSEAITKFCLNLHYNGDSTYLFVSGK